MTQTQEQKMVPPALERSEELVGRIEQNIRSFAVLSWQRTQEAAKRVGAGRASTTLEPAPTQAGSGQDGQPSQPERKPVERTPQAEMQRAERLVDDMAQHLALLTSEAGLQIRRMAAYAREGAEDIWVEAQHIRSRRISQ